MDMVRDTHAENRMLQPKHSTLAGSNGLSRLPLSPALRSQGSLWPQELRPWKLGVLDGSGSQDGCLSWLCWELNPSPGGRRRLAPVQERVFVQVCKGLSGLGSSVPAPSLCAFFGG